MLTTRETINNDLRRHQSKIVERNTQYFQEHCENRREAIRTAQKESWLEVEAIRKQIKSIACEGAIK
jgi:hypothetical protein